MRSITALARAFGITLVASVALAGVASAQIYKQTDANGRVQYSDRAPSDATQVKGPTPQPTQPEARPAAPNAPPRSTSAVPALPVSGQQTQQVQRDVAAARAVQCKQARENYDNAVRALRIYRTNDKGEKEFVSPAEADAARLQMKASMDDLCGG
jgi:uncharacterized protein DUF4124